MTKSKQSPNTTIIAKVVHAIKKQQTFYNDGENKIVELAMKKCHQNLNFLIDQAMVVKDIKLTLKKPQTLNKAWNHPKKNLMENGKTPFTKNL